MANERRRKHGEGTIRQRNDGRWVGVISLGFDERGKRRRQYIYGKTDKEVAKKLRDAIRDFELGIAKTRDTSETLESFADRWLEDVVKLKNRPRTYQDYRTVLRAHISPYIGQIPLTRLTPLSIQNLYGQLERELTKPKEPPKSKPRARITRLTPQVRTYARTRQKVHVLLHAIFEYAVKVDKIATNPVKKTEAPRYRSQAMQTLSIEQVNALLAHTRGSYVEVMVVLGAYLGLRFGEAAAIRWDMIDLESQTISVNRSIEAIGGKRSVSETKTSASRRNLHLPDVAIEALKRYHDQQKPKKNAPLFTDHKNGSMRHATFYYHFRKALFEAQLPLVRFHDLRHTTATLLFALGVHPKIVMEILGHSNVNTTLGIYSHALPHLQTEAMNKLNAAISQNMKGGQNGGQD